MKKSFNRFIGVSLGTVLSLGFAIGFGTPEKEVKQARSYSTNASTYYSGITATSGKELAGQLHDLITSTHQTYTSYADNGGNGKQKITDRYYENGVAQSGYIYEFYSGVKWPDGWYPDSGDTRGGYNREHCWCQSNSVNASGTQMWGESGGGADMHHLRPVESRLNSTRGNNKYGEISNRDSNKVYAKYGTNATYALGGYNNGGVFEPLDSKKGDVARIILYTYLHYNSYSVSSLFGGYANTNGNGSSSYFSTSLLSLTKITNQTTEAKAQELLLSWNASDPVDDIETRRNEQVATIQGNRNPFIDNSQYADMIWGDGPSPSTPIVSSVTVTPESLNLDLNGTTTGTLTADVVVLNGAPTTVTWSSTNENVATVSSSGVVTAVAKGSCSIIATSTYNANKSDSCTVKVADSSGGGGETETGDFTWNLSIASYDSNPTADLVTWSHEYATMESIRTDSTKTAANNYLGGDSNQRTSSRFYNGSTLEITPSSNYEITSVIFTATTNNYATTLGNSNWTNATASVSNSTVTVTPIDGSSALSAAIGGTCGFTAVQVNYSTTVLPTLTDISLNTSNVQTEFDVGDTFDYSGLVVTAYYSNGTEDIVNPTSVSSPNMTTIGEKEITVTYTEGGITKSKTYTICVVDNKELSNITVSGYTSTFVEGDEFSFGGTVTAHYSDSTTEDVTSLSSFDSYDMTAVGNQTVIVTYINETVTYSITVNKGTPSSLSLSGQTTNYSIGSTFSFDGTATATFANGYQKEVTPTSVSSPDMSTEGNKTVTVSYTYNSVTVSKNYTISVSADTYYEKVTNTTDLTSGKYLIVYENGNYIFDGSLSNLDSTPNTISVTIANYKIRSTSTIDASSFTYDSSSHTFLSTSGYYIGRTSDSNGLDSSTTIKYTNTVTIDENGNADVVGSGDAHLRYNATSGQEKFRYYKSTTYTSQKAIQLYKYSSGSPSTTYSVTYDANGGTGTLVDPNSPYTSGATVTVLDNTFARTDYSFSNWNTAADGSGTSYNEGGTFTISGNVILYAIWSNGPTPVDTATRCYTLVTDVNQLAAGCKIIITSVASEGSAVALSTTQAANNRPQSGPITIQDDVAIVDSSDVQVITLSQADSNWEFNVGDGYLYAASSTNNYLRTQTTNDANGQWTISISEGEATVTAQGSNTRNLLRYNSSSKLFSCYGSGQQAVQIYKLSFEETLLYNVTCDGQGSHTLPTGYSWNTDLKGVYDDLPLAEQTALKTASNAGTARYDYIVGKYGTSTYNDFIGRNPSPIGHSIIISAILNNETTNTAIVVVVTAISTALAVGGYFFLRKKKED